MRFLVFGAGAVGQALGCMLAADSVGHHVDLIVRGRFLTAIRDSGLRVSGIFGDHQAPPGSVEVYADMKDIADRSYDYIIVTTKSYNTGDAVSALKAYDNASCIVVSMQNGCGNMELLADTFGEDRTLGARVITGFEIERAGLVRITVSADDIHIGGCAEGRMSVAAERLATAIDHAGLPCKATAYVQRDLYAKLLYNCALNPLGAILGVHYGALADDPDSRMLMDAVIGEVFQVIEALGGRTLWDTPEEYRTFFYDQQVPATYDHRSSMLQDLEQGKPTEVDALTGWIAARGRENGIATPYCEILSRLVRFRERMNAPVHG